MCIACYGFFATCLILDVCEFGVQACRWIWWHQAYKRWKYFAQRNGICLIVAINCIAFLRGEVLVLRFWNLWTLTTCKDWNNTAFSLCLTVVWVLISAANSEPNSHYDSKNSSCSRWYQWGWYNIHSSAYWRADEAIWAIHLWRSVHTYVKLL